MKKPTNAKSRFKTPFSLVAPLGTADVDKVTGRIKKKPWEYAVTAAIPHLDTLEALQACIAVLRAQTERPYIMVIDTGSPCCVREQLEKMRAEDLEIHYISAHAWRHSSEPVTAALDLAQTLCRSKLLFHTHADCFLRRPDFIASLARVCNANTPVIGYRMSPRDWVTKEWQWMVGHTATMLYMPSIHRVGATWCYQRIHYGYGYPWRLDSGWPDTETAFNHALRDGGILPVFIGYDRNGERQIDDNIDHVRSYPGTKIYGASGRKKETQGWMESAIRDAMGRAKLWSQPV